MKRALAAAVLTAIHACASAAALDQLLPAYEPRPAAPPPHALYLMPDGTVRIVCGNRGMGVVIEGFNELFTRTHSGTRFRVEYNREGNSVNMAALVHGTTMVGPMGRDANGLERDMYRGAIGGDPLYVSIAHGTLSSPRMTAGLAIYVNKANPVRRLTLEQLARVFTTGAPGEDVTHWGQLGATGAWASRPIHAYGTPEASGYGYYMLKNQWADRPFTHGYQSFDLAAQIVKRVGEDDDGIGFAGQGFLTPETALVAIAERAGGPYMEGTEEEVASGRYPLGRTVDLAVRRVPGEPLDPFVVEYLRLALSREGQAIVAAEPGGYVPLNAAQVARELAKLATAGEGPGVIRQPRPAGVAAPAPYVLADGSISIVGDSTMAPLVDALNELYRGEHPAVRFTTLLKSPATGIDGITAGVSLLAPLAHDAWEMEIEPFKRLKGYRPLDIRIGRLGHAGPGRDNPPAVYVNMENPLARLDMGELARIFTSSHSPGDLRRWSQLGLGGAWGKHAIHLYGTRDDGGHISTIRSARFGNRAFARHYEALPTDADVLEAVAGDRYGIGLAWFVTEARVPPGVKMVPLSALPGAPASAAGRDDVRRGRYPLSPYLHLYIDAAPGKPLDALGEEYAHLALSPQGQELIDSLGHGPQGYVALTAEEASREREQIFRKVSGCIQPAALGCVQNPSRRILQLP